MMSSSFRSEIESDRIDDGGVRWIDELGGLLMGPDGLFCCRDVSSISGVWSDLFLGSVWSASCEGCGTT